MFLLDKPYVSDFLKRTIKENAIPVVDTIESRELGLLKGTNIISEETAKLEAENNPLIYTNSENTIGWISENLSFTDIPQKIELFKDKYKFRELISDLFPDFFYKKVDFNSLDEIDISSFPFPFIIKPSVGFFSMGVYKVNAGEEWSEVKEKIKNEVSKALKIYPDQVISYTSFIIEQCINGEEFAIDTYFDSQGDPVILNILQHAFSDDSDVSDRIYMSSKEIIKNNFEDVYSFLKKIGELAQVKNFPCHVELRKESDGTLIPIEINPMRFGGWCTTPDFTYSVYGINSYLYYYNQQKPDWDKVLEGKDNKVFSLIVLDNSTGVDGNNITSFNYEKLLSDFAKPLELRRIDYKEYPIFGFLFTESADDNLQELENILKSNLREYITAK
ncbi:ATP-grasp domain-containing protein [Desulforhopalus vacuolatus]|uniref:ATP-grasp domain-containing protein n=1 Tax=Desulforhopalus vacuolatus TaxID=40414 RepID=UPI0019627496|nr:ATP-grasp domain-containing protein [Desulforhopalus vacuolatus]MBM9520662.1 ATP-grasp domain-containing protein [Desulforhopalus vacuolatus]